MLLFSPSSSPLLPLILPETQRKSKSLSLVNMQNISSTFPSLSFGEEVKERRAEQCFLPRKWPWKSSKLYSSLDSSCCCSWQTQSKCMSWSERLVFAGLEADKEEEEEGNVSFPWRSFACFGCSCCTLTFVAPLVVSLKQNYPLLQYYHLQVNSTFKDGYSIYK